MNHKTTITAVVATVATAIVLFASYAVSGQRPRGLAPANTLRTEAARTSADIIKANRPAKADAEENVPELFGIVGSADGIYVASFDAAPDIELTQLYKSDKLAATGAAVYVNEKLYVNVLSSNGAYNTTTQHIFRTKPSWRLLETKENLPYSSSAKCLTYDATTDLVYGAFYNDEIKSETWGTLDLNTGTSWSTGAVSEDLVVIAGHPNGKIYGVNTMGMFMEINKNDGSVRRIGHTDVKPAYMQSAVIDQQTGRFYWAAYTDTGTSGLYEVDIETGAATLISPFPGNVEIVGLFMEAPAVSAEVPAEVSDISLDFEGASLTGNVKFKAPETTEGGAPIDGDLTATVFMDGKTWTATAAPGSECAIEVTASGEGYHNFYIYTTSANGPSRKANRQKWIGNDTPLAVKNVNLVNDNGTASLTWNAPTGGVNGGFVDPERVTYIIRRAPDNKVTEGVTGAAFADEISSESLSAVHYRIIPVFEGKRGEYADSQDVLFGESYSVPASVKFGDRATLGMCAIVDANGDGNTWTWDYSGSVKYSGKKSAGRKADDWVITPPVELEPGSYYKVSFPIYGKNAPYFPHPYEVWIGTGKDVVSMTQCLAKDTLQEGSVGNMEFVDKYAMVKVDKPGKYYFGFRTTTDSYNDFYVSGIAVEKTCALTSSEAPTEMAATGADGGKLEALITMKAPSCTLGGESLASVRKIELYRDKSEYISGILVKREWVLAGTAENVMPGTNVSFTDRGAQQGTNLYKAVPYGDDGMEGAEATAECWCGVDIPAPPQTVTLSELPQEQFCLLQWDTPVKGVNGGYIDPAGLVYTVLEPAYGTVLADGITGNTVRISIPLHDNSQYAVSLLVGVTNIAGNSPSVTASNSVIVGNPFTLPVVEDFPRRNLDYNWFMNGSVLDEGGWNTTLSNGVDGDSGFAIFHGLSGDEQRLISGKISLKDAVNPTLRFFVAGITNSFDELIIETAENYSKEYTPLFTLHAPEGGWKEWTPYEISLKDFTDRDFIHLAFHAKAVGMDCNFALDNITVRDVQAKDLEIKRLAADCQETKVAKDGCVSLSAIVENRGFEPVDASRYSVRFTAAGRTVATLPGVSLEPYARHTYTFDWNPTLNDPDDTPLAAEVVYDEDMDSSNNVAAGVAVALRKPQCPKVDDLAGSQTDGGYALLWSRPDLSGRPVEYVTDDFESYLNQAINTAGEWTIRDLDGMPTTTEGYYFLKMGYPMGYIVMDTDEIPYDTETALSTRWPAHSGSKFLASFASTGADNDDWLITPLLSGKEQEISFYAMSALEDYGHESFEILYSVSGTEPADFIKLTDNPVMVPSQWTLFTYRLPEGARYCAVCCISHNRMGLFVDDFTYESAERPLEITFMGYNVYRDGELLTPRPLLTETYTDPGRTDGIYKVRVVYDLGESEDSNSVGVSGIESIGSDVQAGADVWYDLYGRCIPRPSVPGIYIHGGKKVIVK